MTPEEIAEVSALIVGKSEAFGRVLEEMPLASPEAESDDLSSDLLLEAHFLRTFTDYEAQLERLFLHYVTGGLSVSGKAARSFLAVTDESLARKIIVAGYGLLSWAKPGAVRDRASNYLEHGWPIFDMLSTEAQNLSDCEKVRNRIAHQSVEAKSEFAAVQRNLFQTERVFDMSPGHLLRSRFRGRRKMVAQHYNEVLSATLLAVLDPPD